MPGKITPKQQQILDYIKEEILSKGYPPTVRDMWEGVGLKVCFFCSLSSFNFWRIWIHRRKSPKPRAIEIMDDEFGLVRREMTNIPIIGRVAAGAPLLAVENIEDYFALPTEFLPNGEVFILKVQGESMINVGFYEGDYLIIEKAAQADNGEIVVALIDDSVTVKRFFKEDGHIRLQPENDLMEPIIVDDCAIVGIVRSLYRRII